MKTYHAEKVTFNGKEYINMASEIFHSFFKDYCSYMGCDENVIKDINNQYNRAKRIKRIRIRQKKEKQALIRMYDVLLEYVYK